MKAFKKFIRIVAFAGLIITAITENGSVALVAVAASGIAVGIIIVGRMAGK